MNAALAIIGFFFIAALVLGLLARIGRDMNLEQWTVGGRGLGSVFVFLLLAGEIYTTFTFLGGSSWAYGKGGPALFIIAYGTLAYVMSYWLLPPIWRYAKAHGLVSQSDFFAAKYNSPYLGVLVSIVGIVAMIPYLVLQFQGLKLIVETTSYGSITGSAAVWIGAAVITLYVIASGLRGSAWTAALKDLMILAVVVFLGIYLPLHYHGGFGRMFGAIDHAHPGFLKLPAHGNSPVWFASTICLTMLGFYMWPHTFGSAYSARHERVFRKNAIWLPLYQLVLLFVFFVGFAAIGEIPHLANNDLALLQISLQTFPPWMLGLIGAAGLLAALVPGAMLMMATSTLAARNIIQVLRKTTSDDEVAKLAKWLVPVVALAAIYFTFAGGKGIVALLLMAYSFVTQLFPALLLSLVPNHFGTKQGAAAGIMTGMAAVAWLTLEPAHADRVAAVFPPALHDLNPGIAALILNVLALLVVSVATRAAGKRALRQPLAE